MIQEFRRARRRNVPEPVAVMDALADHLIGRLGNVSESGMLLIASAPIVEDAIYQLRFHLRVPGGREMPIEVGAHVLWMAAANTPGQSFAGLRFLTIEPAQLDALRAWVNAPGPG
ncbi:PilZ domain-containing protein [Pseudoxanthomonas beigongshangi]